MKDMIVRQRVELKINDGETPALALSRLLGRILAVEMSTNSGMDQIGQAFGFHLARLKWPDGEERVGLCCTLEADYEAFENAKPLLLDGGYQLFVGNNAVLWSTQQ